MPERTGERRRDPWSITGEEGADPDNVLLVFLLSPEDRDGIGMGDEDSPTDESDELAELEADGRSGTDDLRPKIAPRPFGLNKCCAVVFGDLGDSGCSGTIVSPRPECTDVERKSGEGLLPVKLSLTLPRILLLLLLLLLLLWGLGAATATATGGGGDTDPRPS